MFMDTFHPIRILKAHTKNVFKDGLARLNSIGMGPDLKSIRWQDTSWRDGLPDEIKTDPLFEKYETANDAHKALLDAQKLLGREKLPVPSGPEDKAAFDLLFKATGRPDTVEGYATPTDIQFEEGFPPVDEEFIKTIKQVALDGGMSAAAWDKIYRGYMDYSNTQFKNAKTKVVADKEASVVAMRKEFGAAYPQMEALAQKVVLKFADEAAWNTLDGGLGNNPAMVKMLSNIGKLLSEHQLVGEPAGLSFTPQEAQSEIDKIRGDLKGPFYKEDHPLHKETVDKVDQLTKLTLVGK